MLWPFSPQFVKSESYATFFIRGFDPQYEYICSGKTKTNHWKFCNIQLKYVILKFFVLFFIIFFVLQENLMRMELDQDQSNLREPR